MNLEGSTQAELADVFRRGKPVTPTNLGGFAFRGVSLGLPSFIDRVMWKTFVKVFAVHDGDVRGFNLRVDQAKPWAYRIRSHKPRFGEFVAVADGQRTNLDYRRANPAWHPLARMVDRIVGLDRADANLFLGRADIGAMGMSVKTPSYFTLERGASIAAAVEETGFAQLHLELASQELA